MKKVMLSISVGLLLGILTSFGQTYLPEPIKQFANSFSIWLLISFVFGVFTQHRRQALVCGATIQVAALVGYYITSDMRFASGVGATSILLFWLIGGITAGPILTLGGYFFAQRTKWTNLSVAAMTAVILLEAIYMLVGLHRILKSLCFIGLAVVFVLVTIAYTHEVGHQRRNKQKTI